MYRDAQGETSLNDLFSISSSCLGQLIALIQLASDTIVLRAGH